MSWARRTPRRLRAVALVATVAAAAVGQEAPRPGATPDRGLESTFLVDAWSTADGLPQNSVKAIVHGRDGYLWLATFGGLVRFDGVRHTVFDIGNTPELPGNRVLSLCEDGVGRLWIGCVDGGIACRVRGHFRSFAKVAGAPRGTIWAMARAADGSVWFGGDRLVRWADGRFSELQPVAGRPLPVLALTPAADGMWVGTEEGLFHYRQGRFERVPGLSAPVWVVHASGPGDLWVSTHEGVAVLRDGTLVEVKQRRELRGVWVTLRDGEGRVWAGTRHGLYRLQAVSAATPDVRLEAAPDELPPCAVASLLDDGEGNLWVGTETRGLLRMRRAPFARLTGITQTGGAVQILPAAGGQLWVRDGIGPVCLVRNGHVVRRIDAKKLIPSGRVVECAADGDTLWAVARKTLARWRDGTCEHRALGDRIDASSVRVAGDGTVWVGGTGGLLRVRGDQRRFYDIGPCALLAMAPDGTLWLGGPRGLGHFDDGLVQWLGTGDGLQPGELRAVWNDGDGTLWITSYGGGLSRLRDGVFVRYTAELGLADNALGGIVADDKFLWVNSNLGVLRLQRSELRSVANGSREPLSCRVLRTGEGNGPTGVRSGGRLWFPTIDGVVAVDPSAVRPNEVAPTVAVEWVFTEGKRLPASAVVEGPPGGGDFAIGYAAMSYSDPGGVRYKYQLEGFDADWNDAGHRRTAYYTKVPPGHYTFRVIAANADGTWNRTGAALALALEPRLYQRTWFHVLCGLAVGLAAVGAHLLRLRSVHRKNASLHRLLHQRALVEEALRLSEERYRVMAETATEAILTVGGGGVVRYANGVTGRMFGLSMGECLGRPLDHLLPGVRIADMLEDAGEVEAGRPCVVWSSREVVGRRRDGGEFPVEVSFGVMRQPDGELLFTGILRDISERRMVEQQRTELERQLRESSRLEAVGRLAGGISHDFNNILTALLGHTELLEEMLGASASEEVQECVAEVRACSQRARSLTRQLLAFSRQPLAKPEVVDVRDVLRRLEPMLRRLISEHITLGISTSGEPCTVRADVGQLEQVIMNLVLNGRDAMPRGGTLEVAVGPARPSNGHSGGSFIELIVTDSGSGIEASALPHVFEPFFTTKRQGGGTGLGLASVKGIVTRSGGSVSVESEPGKGSVFRVRLPRVVEPAVELPSGRPARLADLQGEETVLLCDDEKAVLGATAGMLTRRGYRVLAVSGPAEALATARDFDEPIHLLITDVIMPELNGRQLMEAVRAERPDIVVLFMSGYTDNILDDVGVGDAGFEMIQKPFAAEALLRKVRELLGPGRKATEGA